MDSGLTIKLVAEYAIVKLNEGMRPDKLLTSVMKKKIKRKMWADYDIFLILTKQLEKQEEDLGVKTK